MICFLGVHGKLNGVIRKCPLNCPSDTSPTDTTNYYYSYGYNLAVSENENSITWNLPGLARLHTSTDNSPSKTLLLGESNMNPYLNVNSLSSSTALAYRHNNTVNLLFLDTHLEAWKRGKAPDPMIYGRPISLMRSDFWNNRYEYVWGR